MSTFVFMQLDVKSYKAFFSYAKHSVQSCDVKYFFFWLHMYASHNKLNFKSFNKYEKSMFNAVYHIYHKIICQEL